MTDDLKNILFIDIETVAATDQFDTLDERLKVQWARKASFFKQREEGSTDEDLFHERAGIYAEFGKIIVIAIGKFTEMEGGQRGFKTRRFAGHDEKQLLIDFRASLEKMEQQTALRLCAHNGKEFDFPYLSRRMLINGLTIPNVLSLSGKKPWDVPHLDTMELWKFGDHKHYTSLELLAAVFEIPTSKNKMDGSMVNAVYYKEKDLTRIAEYCVGDVVAVAQLILKMRGMNIIPEQNIQHS